MPLSIRCPKCQAQHKVKDELRGRTVKCNCGAKFKIPEAAAPQPAAVAPAAAAPAGTVAVQCPGCSTTHNAAVAMAGQMVRCGCGATFQVPGASQPAAAGGLPAQTDPFGAPQAGPDPFGGQADPFGGAPIGGAPMGGQAPAAGLPPVAGSPPGMAGDPFGADLMAAEQAAPMANVPPPTAQAGPYAPPREPQRPKRGRGGKNPGRCYNCGSGDYSTPVFTWWGGMVGQHLIAHVVCNRCHHSFNSRTGQPNTTNIVLYHVVIIGFGITVGVLAIVFGE